MWLMVLYGVFYEENENRIGNKVYKVEKAQGIDTMEEMKAITLKELFDNSEMKSITDLINKNKWKELRIFLNEKGRKKKLLKKGVFADYLYYYLQAKINISGESTG